MSQAKTPQAETPRKEQRLAWLPALLAGLAILLLTLFALSGAGEVPFHPDESTYLFMSADFDLYLRAPLSLAWDPARPADPQTPADWRQRYRLLDAPLTRYLLGAGRTVAGLPALPADWNWGKTWEENRQAGAQPAAGLLAAGRAAVTLLLPLTLFFLYLSGSIIGGRWTGLLAVLFLGLNALIQLHARRAMTEGALVFGVSFALWSFLQGDRRAWLAGMGAALAFAAKHSALALFPVGLLAVCWAPGIDIKACLATAAGWRRLALQVLQYAGLFLLVTLALNPVFWRDPLHSLRAAWQARQDLIQRQVADALLLAPHQVLQTPGERSIVLLANLYLAPPSFYEVGNYRQQTQEAERAYLAAPLHTLGRSLPGAGLFLALSLTGAALALLRLRRVEAARRRALALALTATLAQFAALAALTSLSWQRYVIPLVPLACLWAAYAIGSFRQNQHPGEKARV
jgi:hypothetical protein